MAAFLAILKSRTATVYSFLPLLNRNIVKTMATSSVDASCDAVPKNAATASKEEGLTPLSGPEYGDFNRMADMMNLFVCPLLPWTLLAPSKSEPAQLLPPDLAEPPSRSHGAQLSDIDLCDSHDSSRDHNPDPHIPPPSAHPSFHRGGSHLPPSGHAHARFPS